MRFYFHCTYPCG